MRVVQTIITVLWMAAVSLLRLGELHGMIPGYVLPIVLVLMSVSVFLLARRAPESCGECRLDFSGAVPFALLFLGAVLLLGASVMQFSQNTGNGLLLLEAVAGAVLLLHAFAERAGKQLPADMLLVPVVAQVVRLIFTYRTDAANPDLGAYYIGMLATAAVTLGLLLFVSYYFRLAKPRVLTAMSAVTAILSTACAAEGQSLASAGIASAWALVFLAVLAAFRREETK